MKILALDTSGKTLAVAVAGNGAILGEVFLNSANNHSVTLMPMIKSLLDSLNLTVLDLTHIACVSGPGSFTGLRIGAAAAKALAYAADIPVVAVPTLDALAYNVFDANTIIAPIMDARRGQVYTAFYERSADGGLACLSGCAAKGIQDALRELSGFTKPITFLGDGAPVYKDEIINNGFGLKYAFAPLPMLFQRASSAALLAIEMAQAGKLDSAGGFVPFYLRKPQAERARESAARIEIQHMGQCHIDQVYQIELDSFSIPWSRRDFEKELENNLAIYIVALQGGEVVGYAGMWHVVNEGHIINVAVKNGSRRQGVGAELIKKLISIASDKEMMGLTLEVRMSNAAGQGLYHKFGFKPEGIRRRYYSDTGEDAIIMWKYLKQPVTEVLYDQRAGLHRT